MKPDVKRNDLNVGGKIFNQFCPFFGQKIMMQKILWILKRLDEKNSMVYEKNNLKINRVLMIYLNV